MRQTHRAAYLALTGFAAVAGGSVATIGGADARSVVLGLVFAWALQAASFWPLAGALETGRPVVVPWVAGMAARLGGLAALWAVSALSGRGREALLAYAFALVTFLLLEAAWLAVVTRGAIPGTDRSVKGTMLVPFLLVILTGSPPALAAPVLAPPVVVAVHADVLPQDHGEPSSEEAVTQEVQDHVPAAEEHAEDAEHSEEWGTEAMMHHIVDSNELEFGSTKIELPRIPPIQVGRFEIDLSPTKHVFFLWIATLLTILTVWFAARRASRTDPGEEAPGGLLNAFESFYVYLRDDVALANIGHGGEKYVPYVVTLFFFILFANLLGLVPFGATATSNIMVTAALALISLAVVEASGMSELGFKGWLGTIFYAPAGLHPIMKVVMLFIMTPVELIGKLAKPFALAVRLFANMTAGHFVILALLGLILTYGSFTKATGIAAISGSLLLGLFVMFLEIFVAFLQAYIFTALTAVFIGLIRHAH